MNYIKQLEKEVADLKADLQAVKDRDSRLLAYLTSRKFNCGDTLDGYVNVVDVITVIR